MTLTAVMLNLVGLNATKMCPVGEMLNMLNFFWADRPISNKFRKPQKFNMFNIFAVSLTFFSPKPTDFNISPVGINFLIPGGEMLNFVVDE